MLESSIATVAFSQPIGEVIFDDNFESKNLNKQTTYGDDDWDVGRWIGSVFPSWTDFYFDYNAHVDNCDDSCKMKMKNDLDLTQYTSAQLSFYVKLDKQMNENDGFTVKTLGNSQKNILALSANVGDNTGVQGYYEFDLINYLDYKNFNLEFTAISDSSREFVELDQVQIYGEKIIDTIPPIITILDVDPQTIELGKSYTELRDITDDGSPVTIDSSAFTDAVGSYTIYYNSVDSAGNHAVTVTRTVHVVTSIQTDIIPPVITLIGGYNQELTIGESYIELGATAVIDTDEDISISIVIDSSSVDITKK